VLRYRSQRIALAVSVLIHVLILFVYSPLSRLRLFPAPQETALAEEAAPLVFELVETPADAIRQRPDDARLVSDKNALARDEYRGDDKKPGDAYSEGQTPYRIFAGDAEPAGADGAAESRQPEVAPSGVADPAVPTEAPTTGDPLTSGEPSEPAAAAEPSNLAASEDYLKAQVIRSPLSKQRPYSDDLDFNQRLKRAENLGNISLSTYEWDYAYYIMEMKRKLKSNIFPPAAFTQLGIISGEAVLRFRVQPNGTATDVTLVGYTGDRSLMETSLDAVRLSSPFRPLPPDFPDEYLELTWTFIYSVYR
jgi:outer membrane biosynthesis protein TonB